MVLNVQNRTGGYQSSLDLRLGTHLLSAAPCLVLFWLLISVAGIFQNILSEVGHEILKVEHVITAASTLADSLVLPVCLSLESLSFLLVMYTPKCTGINIVRCPGDYHLPK